MSTKQRGRKRKATEAGGPKAKTSKEDIKLCDDIKWGEVGELVKGIYPLITYTSATVIGQEKVAGFDIDFTVVKTKSGKKFAAGVRDWEWWDTSVPEKLKEVSETGHRVIFFTNQAGIEKKKVPQQQLQTKIENIIKKLGIPVFVFICTGENEFRKPSPLMWDLFEEKYNKGVKVNRGKSIYVGDAAGRAKNWAPGKPKDFSCSDRKFAANLGVKFQTPEEFFLRKPPAKFSWLTVNPATVLKTMASTTKKVYHSKKQEVVVMVGCPASGKSTFRKRYLEPHGYVTVNRDTLGTFDRCAKVAVEALSDGKSVVADNTNPSVAARKMFIERAKKFGVPCRCFIMNTPVDLAHHMNYFRQTRSRGKQRRVPDIAYNMFKSQFEDVTMSEGFSEIVNIDFVPEFENKDDEDLFKQWT